MLTTKSIGHIFLVIISNLAFLALLQASEIKDRYEVYHDEKWNMKNITYKIINYPSHLEVNKVDEIIRKAFWQYEYVTALTFTQIYEGKENIEISFNNSLQNNYQVLFLPWDLRRIQFNKNVKWEMDGINGKNLLIQALQIIGKTLGLWYSSSLDSIFLKLDEDHDHYVELGNDDIAGVIDLYGPNKDTVAHMKKHCQKRNFQNMTIFSIHHHQYIIFNNDEYYRIDNSNKMALGYPRPIHEDWEDAPKTIDTAVMLPDGFIYIFSGAKYWKYNLSMKLQDSYPKEISESFNSVNNGSKIETIDAAFIFDDGTLNMFLKKQYWKMDAKENTTYKDFYPSSTSYWGLNSPINSVVHRKNTKLSYFFQGDIFLTYKSAGYYYPFGYMWSVIGNAKPTYDHWMGCNGPLVDNVPSVSME